MPICSVAAILEGGYRQKDTVRLTGLSVISYTAPENSSIAELREEARADPHTLLLFGTADTLNIIFSYELDQEYELRQQKLFYSKAFDYACDYYDQLMGVKTNRTDKGRMVQLTHDAEAYYNTYAEPFYAWEIKEANTAKREGRKPRGDPREHKQNWKEIYASVKDIQNFLDENIQLRHNIITRRVEFLKKEIAERGLQTLVQVDGGIAKDTIATAAKAGVDICVAGTAVFGEKDAKEAIDTLKALCE